MIFLNFKLLFCRLCFFIFAALSQSLAQTLDCIQKRCEDLVRQVNDDLCLGVSIEDCTSEIGGGSVPGSQLESRAVCIGGVDCDVFTALLRRTQPAVLARISDDKVVLDLRTVKDYQVEALASSLNNAAAQLDKAV